MMKNLQKIPAPSYLLAIILIFFHKIAFSNLILARGDVFRYFYPYWTVAAEALQEGRIPFWNPQIFMGAPFLANSQVGFLYPFNWPLWLLLPVPYALSVSILFHLWIAAWGCYLAARRVFTMELVPALLAGFLFSLGGYVSAQVEHINQLQGIAWMPWFLVVLHSLADSRHLSASAIRRAIFTIGILFALQLLAGHTQTAFITGMMVLLWSAGLFLERRWRERGKKQHRNQNAGSLERIFSSEQMGLRLLFALGGGVFLSLLLAGAQLLPTWELVQQSARRGGLPLNEVLSFSLHPALLTRSLLPAYGQSLASEYTSFMPLTAWILALIAARGWRHRADVIPLIFLGLVGFALAFGAYNPLNWLIFRLPGFNLFRAPARWLILPALAASLLAGLGLQVAWSNWRDGRQISLKDGSAWLRWFALLSMPLVLIAWNWGGEILAQRFPTGLDAPFEVARPLSVLIWLAELLLAVLLLGPIPGRKKWLTRRRHPLLLLLTILLLQFLGTRTHPYNQPTTPEAYFDVRPPVARLQALTAADIVQERFLSFSDIFFDVGDQAEIDTIYAGQLAAQARYDYTVAIKLKEVIDANLPMIFGLSSVDGFDGGILPLDAYSHFSTLLLPNRVGTTDGRLREYLDTVPADRWLDLTNSRYLIADKTGDVWRNVGGDFAVYFDRQHPVWLAAGESLPVDHVPSLAATAVYLLADGPGTLWLASSAGAAVPIAPVEIESGLFRFGLPQGEHLPLGGISLTADDAPWEIFAITLVNEEEQTFFPLIAGEYRLVYSGDVKIYANLDALPRAFLVGEWVGASDAAESVAIMAEREFDVRQTAVITSGEDGRSGFRSGDVEILAYAPEKVRLRTESDDQALLVLTDAVYPGWEVAIDGQKVELVTVDTLFRGVFVPAGEHHITFDYHSRFWIPGLFLTGTGILLAILLLATIVRQTNLQPRK